VSGSSILGTGEVALIFDTPSLGQLAMQPRVANPKALRSDGFANLIAPQQP
jgi:chemotaxis protein histidine kinase CheA